MMTSDDEDYGDYDDDGLLSASSDERQRLLWLLVTGAFVWVFSRFLRLFHYFYCGAHFTNSSSRSPLPGLGKLMFPPVFKQKRVRKRTIKKPSNEKLPNTPLINRYSSSSELASSLELPDDPNGEVFMTFLIHKLSKSH